MRTGADREFWETLADCLGDRRQTVTDKLKQFFSEWFQKIRDALTGAPHMAEAAKVVDQAEAQIQEALRQLYAAGIREAAQNAREVEATENAAPEDGGKFSSREIIDKNGKSYGMGVYMDSTLFSGLTEDERVDMFRLYLDEVSGQTFDAVGKNNNPVTIKIAESGRRYTNEKGKTVPVNDDLYRKFKKNHTKQEAVALIDQVFETAKYRDEAPARHKHDWLDDNGKNPWQAFRTYMQEQNGTIYETVLHVTTAANGEMFLYDITPVEIKEVEQSGNSDTSLNLSGRQPGNSGTSPSNNKIAQTEQEVKEKYQNSSRDRGRAADLDLMLDAAESLSEAGGEDYWAALLASAPELAEDQGQLRSLMRDYKAQAKKLAETADKLAEARRQLTTTDRKLNTRGIASMSQAILKDLGAGDAKSRGVAKELTQILTDAYQKGLDAIDRGEATGWLIPGSTKMVENGFFDSVSAFSADSPVGCCETSRRAMLEETCHAFGRHRSAQNDRKGDGSPETDDLRGWRDK